MIYIPEVPETLHSQRERGRLTAQGRRSDDDSNHAFLIINEADGTTARARDLVRRRSRP